MKKLDPSQFIKYTKTRINQNNPNTVFLIGGGRSLLQYLPDKSILKDQNIITANNGYSLYPNALACHFADWVWYTWNKNNLLEKCLNRNITCCVNHNYDHYKNFYGNDNITVFSQGDRDNLTNNVEKLNGGNTGHQIINIAYHLGFKNVVLLGYDLLEEAKTHWHNEHKRPSNTKNFTEVMIPSFNTLKDAKEKYNMNIVNINKQSALKCFDYAELEDCL